MLTPELFGLSSVGVNEDMFAVTQLFNHLQTALTPESVVVDPSGHFVSARVSREMLQYEDRLFWPGMSDMKLHCRRHLASMFQALGWKGVLVTRQTDASGVAHIEIELQCVHWTLIKKAKLNAETNPGTENA